MEHQRAHLYISSLIVVLNDKCAPEHLQADQGYDSTDLRIHPYESEYGTVMVSGRKRPAHESFAAVFATQTSSR